MLKENRVSRSQQNRNIKTNKMFGLKLGRGNMKRLY